MSVSVLSLVLPHEKGVITMLLFITGLSLGALVGWIAAAVMIGGAK